MIIYIIYFTFINLNMDMDEYNFVSMHKGVVDAVISQGAFKEIIGKLKLSSFAKKALPRNVEEDIGEAEGPGEPSTSEDFTTSKPKVSRKGRGKAKGKGKGKKTTPSKSVQPAQFVQDGQAVQKADMMTQTDSDFEEYLLLSEEDFQEYQMYKEKQMMQKYLVETIMEQDFEDYEGE